MSHCCILCSWNGLSGASSLFLKVLYSIYSYFLPACLMCSQTSVKPTFHTKPLAVVATRPKLKCVVISLCMSPPVYIDWAALFCCDSPIFTGSLLPPWFCLYALSRLLHPDQHKNRKRGNGAKKKKYSHDTVSINQMQYLKKKSNIKIYIC